MIIHRAEGGRFWAEVPGFAGCVSEGDTLEEVRANIRDAFGGVLWVIYPKGVRTITENDVLAAGREAGRKDVKVASFSSTKTALKFIEPRIQRLAK